MIVHVVVTPGPMVLAAYQELVHATIHARTVTGAQVMSIQVMVALPKVVRDDIASESQDWDDSETPVEIPAEMAERLRFKRPG